MKNSTTALARVAFAAIVASATGCSRDRESPAPEPSVEPARGPASAPSAAGEPSAAPAVASAREECCMGKNQCRGKGGCAVPESHACKGKNACAGQGGCRAHCPR